MTAVVQAAGLGKRYRRRWGLREVTLDIPQGKVVGLAGPNGAGKTTLLHLATGLLAPTAGAISVLGEQPGGSPGQLARVGFVAQDAPVYPRLTVAGHLRMGGLAEPGLGRRARRGADRGAGPGSGSAGGVAVGRAARPARADPGAGEAAGAAGAG